MKTYSPKQSEVKRNWFLVDLKGKTLGSVATKMADILRGKNKPIYSPHIDCGDYIVAINASEIHMSGAKWDQKTYYTHSKYPGGLKEATAKEVKAKRPATIVEDAVTGMIPRNKLRKDIMSKLKVYAGSEHKQTAQNPQPLEL